MKQIFYPYTVFMLPFLFHTFVSMTPEDFVQAYKAALATQQWANVAPLLHSNATVVFSNGEVLQGISAIRVAYERNFSLIKNEDYHMFNLNWGLKNETIAEYSFDFSWRGTINGEPASGAGKGAAKLLCEEGKWKLIKEQLTKPE
jgi:predicted ester cyclase